MSKAANATEKEPWLTQFDDEISESGEGTCECFLAAMLKDFLLLPNGDSTTLAADTARRIDDFQQQEYLPSDPLMKFQDDQGMGGFLSAFYEVVFTLARLIPYNNSYQQEKLVRLILELRKLPPRSFKIWQEDCLVWTREPVFMVLMEDNWNGNHPSETSEQNGGDGKYSFQELCDQWVNFSCYLARCIQAGLIDSYQNRCKHPSIDIPQGLEQNLPPRPKRDCKVMVAAQYILLAGGKIAEDCFTKPVRGFGPDEWRRWAERLGERSRQEESGNPGLASAVEKAHKYMVSVYPENLKAAS